ncbi:MAG: heme exporter protein CcmD [Betaproteobacteria bacterium]|nr:heme exporter protein CcmD [Betaproteobacteria bacterium]
MESLGEFLAMGGYAAYVWSSYALSAAVLAGLWLTALRRKRDSRRKVAALNEDRQ